MTWQRAERDRWRWCPFLQVPVDHSPNLDPFYACMVAATPKAPDHLHFVMGYETIPTTKIENTEGGVWVVYAHDQSPYLIAAYGDELEARRHADRECPGYGLVIYLLWGEDIQAAEKRDREDHS